MSFNLACLIIISLLVYPPSIQLGKGGIGSPSATLLVTTKTPGFVTFVIGRSFTEEV